MRVALYVPCYNGAAWLRGCLEALLAQSRPAADVAVVDDGSTDDSAEIARSFAPRVRLIQHERNRGLAAARNTALAELECDVLASVDADVFATPNWLGELLGGFDSPRTAAVGGKLLEAHQTRLADRWRAAHMAQHAGDFPLRNPPVLPGANAAVRRDFVSALGGYDESFRTNYEDADLQHRLIERGYHGRYVPDAVAYHQRTDTARSVLRTFWGWLRPPAERAGLFASADGLTQRRAQLTHLARRALWQDFADGQAELSYLSLLVALLFPLADAAHAARLAEARGDVGTAGELRSAGDRWHSALGATEARVPELLDDVRTLSWWQADRHDSAVHDTTYGGKEIVDAIPTAWWAEIRRARERLAAEEGWPAAADVIPSAARDQV
ncbi:MAG TPA: glycosyltransferase family 2 protein, partial [Chloroflexota bacterium]|nr:glycosyltransferase family 2 protein [Chloroflexota bacterium]